MYSKKHLYCDYLYCCLATTESIKSRPEQGMVNKSSDKKYGEVTNADTDKTVQVCTFF